MTNPPVCQVMTPSSLTGDLKALRCTLEQKPDGQPHDGQHRATRSVNGVGKVIYCWQKTKFDHLRQPPVVDLPAPVNTHTRYRGLDVSDMKYPR